MAAKKKRLASHVHVHLEGRTEVYGPDDDVPAEVAKTLGDHVWEKQEDVNDEPEPNTERVTPSPKAQPVSSRKPFKASE